MSKRRLQQDYARIVWCILACEMKSTCMVVFICLHKVADNCQLITQLGESVFGGALYLYPLVTFFCHGSG